MKKAREKHAAILPRQISRRSATHADRTFIIDATARKSGDATSPARSSGSSLFSRVIET